LALQGENYPRVVQQLVVVRQLLAVAVVQPTLP
jgi:hypothetical protein